MSVCFNLPFRLGERVAGPWPVGPRLWLHGASLGEAKMLVGCITFLRERNMSFPIILTVQKAEIMEHLRQLVPTDVDVAMAPLDVGWVRRHFFARVRPWALVLGENELWPGWLRECRKRHIPVALVSGRFRRKFPGTPLDALSCAVMQTAADLQRIVAQGLPDPSCACVGGDWKNLRRAVVRGSGLEMQVRDVDWALISMHRAEWRALGNWIIRKTRSGAAMVLVPRVLAEGDFFREELRRAKIDCLAWPEIRPGSVSLVGQYGLVENVCLRSRHAVMGGSFCSIGVHDFQEPLRLGCKVWVGPNRRPHEDLLSRLLAEKIVSSFRDLDGAMDEENHARELVAAYFENYDETMRSSWERFHTWLERAQVSTFGA